MKPIQREEIDQFNRERYQKVQKASADTAPTLGTAEAAQLLDTRELVYRGRAYSVAPIPWPLGSQILGVLEAYQREPTVDNFIRTAHLSHAVCRPVGFFRRLFWRLHNPFLRATRFEVGRNLGFFWMFHVLDSAGVQPGSPSRGTSSPTWQALPTDTRRGLTPVATPSHGATLSTGSGGWRQKSRQKSSV